MIVQGEIREVIDAYTDDICLYPSQDEDAYKCLMKRLDELGVVRKVESELPERNFDKISGEVLSNFNLSNSDFDAAYKLRLWNAGYKLAQQDMLVWHKESLETLEEK